jgi:hypothetical protein
MIVLRSLGSATGCFSALLIGVATDGWRPLHIWVTVEILIASLIAGGICGWSNWLRREVGRTAT